jgi:8-oxo-dGTP pyrophosphatase MutT (NUDIX family)
MLTFGLIVYYIDSSREITFHIAQRRDSLAYINYLRGNVPPNKLERYLALMSIEEKYRLQHHSFEDLWKDLFSDPYMIKDSYYWQAFDKFEKNLEILKKSLIDDHSSFLLEWSFPKGRKKKFSEPDLVCALREYREETRSKCYLELIDHSPLSVTRQFRDQTYTTYYYIAKSKFQPKPRLYTFQTGSIKRQSISNETGDLVWATHMQAQQLLPIHLTDVLKEAFSIIKDNGKQYIVLQDAINKYGNIGTPNRKSSTFTRVGQSGKINESIQSDIERKQIAATEGEFKREYTNDFIQFLQFAIEFEEHNPDNPRIIQFLDESVIGRGTEEIKHP